MKTPLENVLLFISQPCGGSVELEFVVMSFVFCRADSARTESDRKSQDKVGAYQTTLRSYLPKPGSFGPSDFPLSFWTSFALLRRMEALSFENEPLRFFGRLRDDEEPVERAIR